MLCLLKIITPKDLNDYIQTLKKACFLYDDGVGKTGQLERSGRCSNLAKFCSFACSSSCSMPKIIQFPVIFKTLSDHLRN